MKPHNTPGLITLVRTFWISRDTASTGRDLAPLDDIHYHAQTGLGDNAIPYLPSLQAGAIFNIAPLFISGTHVELRADGDGQGDYEYQ